MQVVYDKLFDLLKANHIMLKTIKDELGLSNSTLDKLRHNGNITTENVGKICSYLKCTPNDIMEIVESEEEYKKNKKRELLLQIEELQKQIDSL